ncbi:MAG: hypothetical protein AB8B50_00580 [Pirellulaceae bacterium]
MNVLSIRRLAKGCCIAAAVLTVSVDALAQERGLPILNTAGRFLGVGYSRGGYHSPANGQFKVMRQLHPANAYRSSQLQYPYHPAYTPSRPAQAYTHGLPPAQGASIMQPYQNSLGFVTPSNSTNQPSAATPQKPAKPAGPPPTWLEPMLNNGQPASRTQPDSKTEPVERPNAVEDGADDLLTAPSDLKGDSKSNGKEDPFGFDVSPEAEISPSDRPGDSLLETPAGSDQLLDSMDDEDDLLLLDGDLSRRKTLRVTPISILKPVPAPVRNRYRVGR